jgi:hypothetical protein
MRGSVSEAFLGFPWCGWRWQREAGFNPALMDIQVLVGTREFPGAHSCGQKQVGPQGRADQGILWGSLS